MTPSGATSTTVFLVLEVIGTVAFAISGVMAAVRTNMDWLGATVLAVVVAIGGGTIRDLLIGELPVAWLTEMWPVLVAMGTSALVLITLRLRPTTSIENSRTYLVADAVGLSSFVILGTEIGLQAELHPLMAVVLGTITGVGGGVLRDLLTGTKPMVLVGQIYAVAGIVGATVFALMSWYGVSSRFSVWLSVLVIVAIRLIAIQRQWSLPKAAPTAV